MGNPLQKIAIIGVGKMGEALLSGMLKKGNFNKKDISITDKDTKRLKTISMRHRVKAYSNSIDLIEACRVIIIAVKPKDIPRVLDSIQKNVSPHHLLISIAAGVRLDAIGRNLPPQVGLIRVMPNTPALVGEAISAICPRKKTRKSDLQCVLEIFKSVGKAVVIEDESLMDAVTGLSGSGPAYVFLMIEAMADGGVRMGLDRQVAYKLAVQTFLGAARLVFETGKHPGELKDMVASPAGTTIEALKVLEEGGLRGLLIKAVEAATNRSSELGI